MAYTTLEFKNRIIRAEEVSRSSQRGEDMVSRWKGSRFDSLYEKYTAPSESKRKAWLGICDERLAVSGHSLRVTGGSSYLFSCAYKATDKEGVDWLIYHTSQNVYAIRL